jgi:hypothetical protein
LQSHIEPGSLSPRLVGYSNAEKLASCGGNSFVARQARGMRLATQGRKVRSGNHGRPARSTSAAMSSLRSTRPCCPRLARSRRPKHKSAGRRRHRRRLPRASLHPAGDRRPPWPRRPGNGLSGEAGSLRAVAQLLHRCDSRLQVLL